MPYVLVWQWLHIVRNIGKQDERNGHSSLVRLFARPGPGPVDRLVDNCPSAFADRKLVPAGSGGGFCRRYRLYGDPCRNCGPVSERDGQRCWHFVFRRCCPVDFMALFESVTESAGYNCK